MSLTKLSATLVDPKEYQKNYYLYNSEKLEAYTNIYQTVNNEIVNG
jgi:hypothetical protein